MPAGLQLPVGTAHEDGWEIHLAVGVGVGKSAAVDKHRVIEQRTVAIGRGLETAEEISEVPRDRR